MEKFLDKNGLITYTNKMKEYINSKVPSEISFNDLTDKPFEEISSEFPLVSVHLADGEGHEGEIENDDITNAVYTATPADNLIYVGDSESTGWPAIEFDHIIWDDEEGRFSSMYFYGPTLDMSGYVNTLKEFKSQKLEVTYNGTSYSLPLISEYDGVPEYESDETSFFAGQHQYQSSEYVFEYPFRVEIIIGTIYNEETGEDALDFSHVSFTTYILCNHPYDISIGFSNKQIIKLDNKYLNVAQSISDGETGLATGDQVYDAIQSATPDKWESNYCAIVWNSNINSSNVYPMLKFRLNKNGVAYKDRVYIKYTLQNNQTNVSTSATSPISAYVSAESSGTFDGIYTLAISSSTLSLNNYDFVIISGTIYEDFEYTKPILNLSCSSYPKAVVQPNNWDTNTKGYATAAQVASYVSNKGFVTYSTLSNYAEKSELSTVALTGQYNDLIDGVQSLSDDDVSDAFAGIHLDWYKVNDAKINSVTNTSQNHWSFHQYIVETDLETEEDKTIHIVGSVELNANIPTVTVTSANYVTMSGSTVTETLDAISGIDITGTLDTDGYVNMNTNYKGTSISESFNTNSN